MAKVITMEELFLDEIRDLYDAEKQLTRALPEMADAASSEELRDAFEEHFKQTENHVERLERIFDSLGEKATGKKCSAMIGLIKEGNELVSETEETAVRDAGMIAAAQRVEHYEIAGYGSARIHAQILGNHRAADLLDETLQEEKDTNDRLTELARNVINGRAIDASKYRGAGHRDGGHREKTRTAS